MKKPFNIQKLMYPLLIIGLLVSMAWQMLGSAMTQGATADEPIHILSGYSVLTSAHILFDPEHPFLAKAVAALPLLFIRPNLPFEATHLPSFKFDTNYNTYTEANEWGKQLLFASGNNADLILFSTRAMMVLLTLGLAILLWQWTKSIWGKASALAVLILIAFEPSFLAHGQLANNDTAATLCFIAAIATFYLFLQRPTYKSILIAGSVLGLGLLTKFSLLLMVPIDVFLLAIWLIYMRSKPKPSPIFKQLSANWARYGLGLISIFIIAWAIIWIGYGSLQLLNPAQNPQVIHNSKVPQWTATIITNTLPVMWVKGVAFLFFPEASHTRDGYLLGQCYTGGRWNYFATVALFKIPLPIIGLFATTILLWWQRRQTIGFSPMLLLIPLLIYLIFSSRSDINIGFRHILPAYALILIMASYPYSLINWKQIYLWIKSRVTNQPTQDKPSLNQRLSASILIALLVSTVYIGFNTFPNYLPYYNLLSAEPKAIPFISSDSNTDWGGGTKQLQTYINKYQITSIAFDNFTGTGEAVYRQLPLTTADPLNRSYKGYLALSRSTIIDHLCTKQNDWGWVIDRYQPIAIIGNTINLYKIE